MRLSTRAAGVAVLVAVLATMAVAQTPPLPCGEDMLKEHPSLLRDKAGKLVWFTHEQMREMATRKVAPKVPPFARTARIQGHVDLSALVQTDGSVACLRVIKGHPLLYSVAIEAAKQWRFKPLVKGGKVRIPWSRTSVLPNFERQ